MLNKFLIYNKYKKGQPKVARIPNGHKPSCFSKKGQVGETVTWVFATIIILVLLIFFIFGTTLLADSRRVISGKDASASTGASGEKDLFLEKSIFTYIKLKDEKAKATLLTRLQRLEENKAFTEPLNVQIKEIGDKLK